MALSLEELAAHCMEMIGYTGEGRSLKIEEAEDHLSKAHEIQFLKLMSVQAGGEEIPCNMLLLHAMDILMTSTAEKDMIKTIVKAKIRKGEGVKE